MGERYITAIDLGTSNIVLTVAEIEGDNIRMKYSRETPSDGIRYNRVINPARAGEAIKEAISLAEEELEFKCREVVSIYPRHEVILKNGRYGVARDENECVTAEDIRELRESAMGSYAKNSEGKEGEALFGAVAQSFNCGSKEFQILERDVIGMTTDELEGNFKLFVGQEKYVDDMDLAFKRAGDVAVVKRYFAPEAMAKAVLYESEMEDGVALIDLGAGVTSVAIYIGGIMRHYAAIPFGGKSVTMDIKSICTISERLAENIKMAYGGCMPERLQTLADKTIVIETDKSLASKQLSVQYLSEIITARETEIINAILYEIQESGFADSIHSVVLSGGGAEMLNISVLVKELSGYFVRIGEPHRDVFQTYVDLGTEGATATGMILLAKEEGIYCSNQGEDEVEVVDNENNEDNEVGTVFSPDIQEESKKDKKKKKEPKPEKVKKKPEEKEEPPKNGGGWGLFSRIRDGLDDLSNEGV